MNKTKLLVLVLILFLLVSCTTGCSDTEEKKCIKEHVEQDTCLMYTFMYTGKVMMPIPVYYDCERTICDEYEGEGEV